MKKGRPKKEKQQIKSKSASKKEKELDKTEHDQSEVMSKFMDESEA